MAFWGQCLKRAFTKGWLAVGIAGTVLSVASPFLRNVDPAQATSHQQFWDAFDRYGVAWISIVVFWLIVGLRVLWAPFEIHQEDQKALRSVQENLHKIEIEKIALLLEFISPEKVDFQLHVHPHKLRVTNLHSSKTAMGVCASLKSLESDAWREGTPPEVIMTKFDLPLPVSPIKYTADGKYLNKCDINPGCSVEFDLAYTRIEMAFRWFIGLPPFDTRTMAGSLSKSLCDFEYGTALRENPPLKFSVYISAEHVPKLYGYDILSFTFGEVGPSRASFSGVSVAHQQNYTPFTPTSSTTDKS